MRSMRGSTVLRSTSPTFSEEVVLWYCGGVYNARDCTAVLCDGDSTQRVLSVLRLNVS
jgi:hypothetical protein